MSKIKKELIEVELVSPDLNPHHKGKRAWWVKYHRNPPKLGENMIKVLIEGFKNAQTWHKSNWKIKEPSRCPHCGEKIRLEPHPSP